MKKTNTAFRLDDRIFITMAVFIIASILLFAYRYKNETPCIPANILFDTTKLYAGKAVSFKIDGIQKDESVWNFGDSSNSETAFATIHTYENPGTYDIKVKIGGACPVSAKLRILERPIVVPIKPAFSYSARAMEVKNYITFTDNTVGAKSQEWFFDQADKVDMTGREVRWTFDRPGKKTIYLRIDGNDQLQCSQTIEIKEAPTRKPQVPSAIKHTVKPLTIPASPTSVKVNTIGPEISAVPIEPKGPAMDTETIKDLLFGIVNQTNTESDFIKYTSKLYDLQVYFNEQKTTLNRMCMELEKVKFRTIKRFDVSVTQNNGYLTILKVGLIKKNFPFNL